MIGDRTGFVHVGNHQVMDLKRKFIDTPFSTYVYDGGYLNIKHQLILIFMSSGIGAVDVGFGLNYSGTIDMVIKPCTVVCRACQMKL
jgi:hypothetical protein